MSSTKELPPRSGVNLDPVLLNEALLEATGNHKKLFLKLVEIVFTIETLESSSIKMEKNGLPHLDPHKLASIHCKR